MLVAGVFVYNSTNYREFKNLNEGNNKQPSIGFKKLVRVSSINVRGLFGNQRPVGC
jgi:hypothetical protein